MAGASVALAMPVLGAGMTRWTGWLARGLGCRLAVGGLGCKCTDAGPWMPVIAHPAAAAVAAVAAARTA